MKTHNSVIRRLAVPLLISTGLLLGAGEVLAAGINGQFSALPGQVGNGCQGTINAVKVLSNGDVIAGGEFLSCSGVAMNRIARWNGTWTPLGSGVDGTVSAIEEINGIIYVGGSFRSAGGQPGTWGIAKWTGANWESVGGGVTSNAGVRALTQSGGVLYAGGDFSNIGGTAARNVAMFDGTSWQPLGSVSNNGTDGAVRALAATGGQIYAGGDFTQVSDMAQGPNVQAWQYARHIARFNGNAWWPLLGATGPDGTNGAVYAIESGPGGLYVGGAFTAAGAVDTTNVAIWNGQWSALGFGLGAGCSTSTKVSAMQVTDNGVYAGGLFCNLNNIARWDGYGWTPLVAARGSGVNQQVNALDASFGGISGSRFGVVVLGGYFDVSGGLGTQKISVWQKSVF